MGRASNPVATASMNTDRLPVQESEQSTGWKVTITPPPANKTQPLWLSWAAEEDLVVVMVPPLAGAVVSGGHEQNQRPSQGCRVPRR